MPRVERRKEPIADKNVGVGECVEQRRLAAVCVADERDGAFRAAPAGAALRRARLFQRFELYFQRTDTPHDPPPVDLELGFAGAAGANPAGLLGKGRPLATKARQAVLQQRQLHLSASFLGAGVLGEDVEDHRCAVDCGAPQNLFEVPLLSGRQLVVEDDGVGVNGLAQRIKLLGLAAPDVGRRVGRVARLEHPADFIRSRRVDQERELVEARFDLAETPRERDDADEHDPLAELPLDQAHEIANFSATIASSSIVTTATRRAGPESVAVKVSSAFPISTNRSPPGL